MNRGECRLCGHPLSHTFVDLGMSPLSNAYVKPEKIHGMEPFYPLHAFVCERCFLVQLEELESPEAIFSEYFYFSSYSDTWLNHARTYVESISRRLDLHAGSLVVEIASNDGYLLQYFRERDIPVLGIEPAANVARAAEDKGVTTLVRFFGSQLARELVDRDQGADLIVGNNVLAHVPDLNDFVAGMKILLKPHGSITMEFPHLLRLMEENQFDTIYHEHFSYFSLITAERLFLNHGLTLYDVEELPTHGGSLRIYARHTGNQAEKVSRAVQQLKEKEKDKGLDTLAAYTAFPEKVARTKRALLSFLISAKNEGKKIAGYGAAAKGNTLLNYCGTGTDFLDFAADRSPHKQGKLLPGTHIPVVHPDTIKEARPDYILILPWNIKEEIMEGLSYVREWGGRFVIPIPQVEVLP